MYLSARERQILLELNQMRSNPPTYAAKLEARRHFYRGSLLHLPDQVPLRTREGVAALEEAIRALRGAKPMPEMTPSRALSLAARDHVRDIGPKGLLAHEGSDRSSPSQRLRRYARRLSSVGEVITFGPDGGDSVIIDLLVDDGVPSRGHRTILFDSRLQLVGISCGPHAAYRTMCVLDLADRLTEGP